MLREGGGNAVDGGGRDQQKQEPTEHLQRAVEALEDNPNLKGSVEQIVRPKPAPDTQSHWPSPYLCIGSVAGVRRHDEYARLELTLGVLLRCGRSVRPATGRRARWRPWREGAPADPDAAAGRWSRSRG